MPFSGTNMKRIRETKGWTQTRLAHELVVASQQVCSWENGQAPVSNRAEQIANVLGVPMTDLFEGEGEQQARKPAKGEAA